MPPEDQIPPAKRKRLQQCFGQANQLMAKENHDYATELFTQCVQGDPSNLLYVQSFLANLKQKYNNNKKGNNLSFIKLAGLRRSVSKAIKGEDWAAAFKSGLQALTINPWDVATLKQMADATETLGYDDVQLLYLKTALDANPKDPDVCRICAEVLTERGDFDQAIALWHRVQQVRPNDKDAERQIANLAVKKTIREGGYEGQEAGKKINKKAESEVEEDEVSPVKKLEIKISRHPEEMPLYFELADLYVRDEDFEKAEEVLARAYESSGGDAEVRERWEDMEIRTLRQKRAAAEKKAKQTDTEEDKQAVSELADKLNAKEVEVYEHRCERYPSNLSYKYFLGTKYQANGLYDKAIHQYQLAKGDHQRKGVCALALGQCFQQIKQYRLAMTHYEEAVQEIPERDVENVKKSLYLAGKLALGLKNVEAADKHLSALAGTDFAYRDVSSLLDKVSKLREDDGSDGDESS